MCFSLIQSLVVVSSWSLLFTWLITLILWIECRAVYCVLCFLVVMVFTDVHLYNLAWCSWVTNRRGCSQYHVFLSKSRTLHVAWCLSSAWSSLCHPTDIFCMCSCGHLIISTINIRSMFHTSYFLNIDCPNNFEKISFFSLQSFLFSFFYNVLSSYYHSTAQCPQI